MWLRRMMQPRTLPISWATGLQTGGFKIHSNLAWSNILHLFREGFSPYNKIYEFGYTVQVNISCTFLVDMHRFINQGQPADMVMTSLSGHLLNMEFAPQFKKWWDFPPFLFISFHIQVLLQSHCPIWCAHGEGSRRGEQQCLDQEDVAKGGVDIFGIGFQKYDMFTFNVLRWGAQNSW